MKRLLDAHDPRRFARCTLALVAVCAGGTLVAALAGPRPSEPDLADVVTARLHPRGAFALAMNPAAGGAAYTVEVLTAEQLDGRAQRRDRWHVDRQLPAALRRSAEAYRHTPFDRGHLAAAANYHGQAERDATFVTSNIVPQHPAANRRALAAIEAHIRADVDRTHDVVVVTVPVYEAPLEYLSTDRQAIGIHAAIGKAALRLDHGRPDHLRAWIVPNRADAPSDPDDCRTSVDALETAAQLELFDALLDDATEAEWEARR